MQIEKFKHRVSNLLQVDKVEHALALILDHIQDNEIHHTLIIHSAGLTRIMKAYNQSLFDWEAMSIERNRIIHKLLIILENIEEVHQNTKLLEEEKSGKNMFPTPEEIKLSNQIDQQYLVLGNLFDHLGKILLLKAP
jgi:hypothetical protein